MAAQVAAERGVDQDSITYLKFCDFAGILNVSLTFEFDANHNMWNISNFKMH